MEWGWRSSSLKVSIFSEKYKICVASEGGDGGPKGHEESGETLQQFVKASKHWGGSEGSSGHSGPLWGPHKPSVMAVWVAKFPLAVLNSLGHRAEGQQSEEQRRW